MSLPSKTEQAPAEKLAANRLLWLEAEKRAKAGMSSEQIAGLDEPTSCRRGGVCLEVKIQLKDGATSCALCHNESLHRVVRPGHYGIHPNAKMHRAEVALAVTEKREILDALRWEKKRDTEKPAAPGRVIHGEEVSE